MKIAFPAGNWIRFQTPKLTPLKVSLTISEDFFISTSVPEPVEGPELHVV